MTRQRRTSPEAVQKTVAYARQSQACAGCGETPGEPCTRPGPGRTVCQGRFIAAAIAVRQQARAARGTPEQQAEADAVLARLPPV
jgi:hypothetical protein